MGKRSRSKKASEEEEEVTVEEASEELPREPTAEEEAEEDVSEDTEDETPEEDEGDGRRTRVMRFAKRLMDRRELSTDTREILGSVLATSDKAKNEAVRMVAREVRSYLDALELKDDLKELISSYSLEISLSLKPLDHVVAAAKDEEPDESPPQA